MLPQNQQEVVIVDRNGTEHRFPPGFDPVRAGQIVRQQLDGNAQTTQTGPSEAPQSVPGQLADQTMRMGAQVAKNVIEPIQGAVEGVWEATRHPVDTLTSGVNWFKQLVSGMGQAQAAQLTKAKEAADKGDYQSAVAHGSAYLLPVVGPMLDDMQNRVRQGQSAEVAGDLFTMLVLPELAKRAPAIKTPGMRTLGPKEGAAMDWAAEQGIPVSAGASTGNQFVRGMERFAEHGTLSGAAVGGAGAERMREGFATIGEQLRAKANAGRGGRPVTMLEAGEKVGEGVNQAVAREGARADAAYDALRAIEERSGAPKRVTSIPTDVRADVQQIIPSPAGTPFAKLRSEEQAAVRSLLAEIESQPFTRGEVVDTGAGEFSGGARAMGPGWVDSSGSAKAYQNVEGTNLLKNTANADAFRDIGGGQSGEQIAARLAQYVSGGRPSAITDRAVRVGQRMLGMVERSDLENPLRPQTGSALSTVAHPIVTTAMETGTTDVLKAVEDTLARHGVRPGSSQFEAITGGQDIPELLQIVASMRESGATAKEVSQAVSRGVRELIDFTPPTLSMVVDLGKARQTLKPLYQKLLRESELQLVNPGAPEARALAAMDRLMTVEGQHAPLSLVDSELGALKSVLRKAPNQFGRDAAALRSVVQTLDAEVLAAAKRAGPEAIKALQEGRQATIAKYDALGIGGGINPDKAQQLAKRITAPDDAGIAITRDLQRHSPEVLSDVGRALLDDIFAPSIAKDGLIKPDSLFNRWQKVGKETKRALFADAIKESPSYLTDLDQFFLAASRAVKEPNPSGSAYMGGGIAHAVNAIALHNPALSVLVEAAGGLGSALSRNPRAVKILTKGLYIPTNATAAKAANLAAFAKLYDLATTPARAQGAGPVGQRTR